MFSSYLYFKVITITGIEKKFKKGEPGEKFLFPWKWTWTCLLPVMDNRPKNLLFLLSSTLYLTLLVFIYFIIQSWWILKSILTPKDLWRLASSVWHNVHLHFYFFSFPCMRSKNYSNKTLLILHYTYYVLFIPGYMFKLTNKKLCMPRLTIQTVILYML